MNTRKHVPGLTRRWFLADWAACLGAARLAAIVAVAVMGLAACSGSSGSSPQVASLGPNGTGATGGTGDAGSGTQSGNPTQLLDQWAACIRQHGDPNQTDPTIDSDRNIEISMTNVSATLANEVHAGGGPCSNYLEAASLALNDGQPQPTDNPVQDDKFAACMRANGFPNWPDSVGGKTNLQAAGIDPDTAAAQNAMNICDQKVGMPDSAAIHGTIQVSSCNAPPGKSCTLPGPGGPGSGGNKPRSAASGNSGA